MTIAAGLVICLTGASDPRSDASNFESDREPILSVEGRHFVDPNGRVVLLRGVNLAGDSKVPPFAPNVRPEDLDRIAGLGFNVVRLLFNWEAFEPKPGVYDEGYLGSIVALAAACGERGLYVIVDVHQDGFSRYTSKGCGEGFPAWAVSPRGTLSTPNNGLECENWPVKMAFDPTMHKSFADFYRDTFGVRTRYLAMIARLAEAFSAVPGVIGYDPLNEPWGRERLELGPLYRDVAAVVRPRHPSAILFYGSQIATNNGLSTRLRRPDRGPVAFAPHYYDPSMIVFDRWRGLTAFLDHGFRKMTRTSESWDAPLFVGEFGMDARIEGAGAYIDAFYDRLDADLVSGAQWNVTPGWTPRCKDGWNGEDFTIVDPAGRLRPTYRPRPYPRLTAGLPARFRFRRAEGPGGVHVAEYHWQHRPDRGETEVFLPATLFPPGTSIQIEAADPLALVTAHHDPARQVVIVRTDRPTPVALTVRSR